MAWPDFTARHPGPEWMDDPAASAEDLGRAYRDLTAINRWTGGRRILARALARLAPPGPGREWTVVDVGCGGCDLWPVVRAVAARFGARARLIGLDLGARREFLQPGALASGDLVLRGDAFAPPLKDGAADLVISSQTLHHLPDARLAPFLRALGRLGKNGALVVDLERDWRPWLGVRAYTRLAGLGPMVRADGPLSVRRGFTPGELRALSEREGLGLSVEPAFPGRIVIRVPAPENSAKR